MVRQNFKKNYCYNSISMLTIITIIVNLIIVINILKARVNLFSYGKERMLILYENNYYITPYKKNLPF